MQPVCQVSDRCGLDERSPGRGSTGSGFAMPAGSKLREFLLL